MRVSVLVALTGQEPLRESASAAKENRAPNVPLSSAAIPKTLQLDESFRAVPLGVLDAGFTSLEAITSEKSSDFAVRGFIETDSMEDIPEEIEGKPVFADPLIAPFAYCAAGAQGNTSDVQTSLDTSTALAKGLDGRDVAVAIVDTGINLSHLAAKLGRTPILDVANSWRPTGSPTLPGQFPVDHGTMCAYNALLAAPNATLLDVPALASNLPGGNVTGRTISSALQAFSYLLSNYAVAFAAGGLHKYKGLVISNSWGIYHPSWDFPVGHRGRYCDNPKHPFAAIVQTLSAAGADIVFAAGNCGGDCPDSRCQGRSVGAIMGANAYAEVLTVAACLVTNKDRLGYSSQGPSISGMPASQKPDLTAYAHFLGSEAFGPSSPDSGTSTACPLVAGCIAAIRTAAAAAPSSLPPASLISQLIVTAKQLSGTPTGWNADYGYGVIDYISAARTLGII